MFEKDSIARGHHIHRKNGTPVGKVELIPMTEDNNEHITHTITIRKDGYAVGYVPRLLSMVSWLMEDPALFGGGLSSWKHSDSRTRAQQMVLTELC